MTSTTTTATTSTTSTTLQTQTIDAPRPTLQPSNSVRISLQHGHSSLGSYQTTCISKHYALNNLILDAFESNYRNDLCLVAYHFGLKFVETALLDIPKHGYFYSTKFSQLRLQSTVDALRVCNILRSIITKEPQDLAKECRKIELLHTLATEQYDRLPTYEHARRRTIHELNKAYPKAASNQQGLKDELSSSTFASTLLACGDTFSSVFCPGTNTSQTTSNDEYKSSFPEDVSALAEEAKRRHLSPSLPPPVHGIKSTSSLLDKDDDERIPPPPKPEKEQHKTKTFALPTNVAVGVVLDAHDSYVPEPNAHFRTSSEFDLQRALFLSGLHVDIQDKRDSFGAYTGEMDQTSEDHPFVPPGAKKREEGSSLLSIQMLSNCYHEDFDTLRNRGRISTRQLPTYQGRIPGSINGCTIIAPLLCIHHFLNESSIPDPGLPDQAIVQVIDEETPNILPLVRQSLGVVKDAFLIPSDAHDSLMQQHYICQEQFLTVCGGNILEQDHLQSLLEQLSVVGPKKLAASLFFHEHVITILQLRRGPKSVWFDVIDSLPHKETFLRADEALTIGSSCGALSRRSSEGAISDNLPDYLWLENEGISAVGGLLEPFLVEEVPPMYATRIRCMDVESLKTTLLWYACSVFSRKNRTYIDNYEWDEKQCDFDPRVFQAFVWTEA